MREITKRQKEVLDFIRHYITRHNFPPTIREISEHFGISVKGAYDHIKALEKKNVIHCNSGRSRTIEILDKGNESEQVINIPVLGNVAAGVPLFAEENFEGTIKVPEHYARSGKHFALNVKGDSMKDAGILDGDIAIFQQRQTADNGDIVVAMIDEAVTLKRFFKEKNRIRLKAENEAYPPIYTQNVRILGKLAHLIRNYE